MYLAYLVILVLLSVILILLWEEERRFKRSISQGLANKYWILRERRRFVRFNEELKIRYNVLRESSNFNNAKTSNISRKGIGLLAYEKLRKKDYVDMEIELPQFPKPIKLIGQVIWTKDLETCDENGRRLFYTGIKFLKINPEAEALLLTHLNALRLRQVQG